MNATKQSHPEGCSAGGIIIPQRAFTAFLFGLTKISGFQVAKTSANKRFLLCLLPFAADVQTSPAQVHGAKVINYFELSK